MTDRQVYVLYEMYKGEELVYEKGAGWWLGLERVSGKTAFALIRMMVISGDSYNKPDFERFHINETGKNYLKMLNHITHAKQP